MSLFNENFLFFSPKKLFSSLTEAIKNRDLSKALKLIFLLKEKFPLYEIDLFYAIILTELGEEDKVLKILKNFERYVLDQTSLKILSSILLRLNNLELFKRFSKFIKHLYSLVPPVDLLFKFSQNRIHIKGSAGIINYTIKGWCWTKGDSEVKLISPLHLKNLYKNKIQKNGFTLTIFQFEIPQDLNTAFTVRITNENDEDLEGSPLTVFPSKIYFEDEEKIKGEVTVIVPVYGDRKSCLRCLKSLLESRKENVTPFDILVVWDHGKDKTLFNEILKLYREKKILLETTPRNMGFLGAVNYALGLCRSKDVVLLNSDTIVCGSWLDRLNKIAKSCKKVATITPFGTSAELVSYPDLKSNFDVSYKICKEIDKICSSLFQRKPYVEIPTGVGFCMYITKEAIKELGGFDGCLIFSGYGEEVDFCLRAREKGFKNLVALNVFVGHSGNKSYGIRKKALAIQNTEALVKKYPYYEKEYFLFLKNDPLRKFREKISLHFLKPVEKPLFVFSFIEFEDKFLKKGPCIVLRNRGKRVIAVLKVKNSIPICDIHFFLPTHWNRLTEAVKRLNPEKIYFSDSYYAKYVCERLSKKLNLEYEKIDFKTSIRYKSWKEAPKEKSSFLVLQFYDLKSLKRLYEEAYRLSKNKVFFYVYNLKQIWGDLPRPYNILDFSEIEEISEKEAKKIFSGILILEKNSVKKRLFKWKIPVYASYEEDSY